MKRTWVIGLLVLPLVALAVTATAGSRERNTLYARLVSANEVPAVVGSGSGSFRATISDDETTIAFEIDYEGLAADVIQGHIHVGLPFTNGGITAFFCGGGAQPACPVGVFGTFSGTMTAANMDPRANGQGVAQGDFAALVAALRKGITYANLHTARFPAGEVRGQVIAF
jgi:hypothetical protein